MEKKVRSRSLAIGLFFTLLFLGIITRIYWVQVIEAPWLLKKAEAKWKENEILPAVRGTIMDRNGKSLAEDGTAYVITLAPKVLNSKGLERDAARGLAMALSPTQDAGELAKLEDRIYEMATRKKANSDELLSEVEVRPEGYKVDGETKQKVDALIKELQVKIELRNKENGTKLDYQNVGIGIRDTDRRYYPFNRLASQVLGYLDKEGKPNYGLESSMDDSLKGIPGKLIQESDRYGVELPNGKMQYTAPVNGKDIKLTLDQNIQYYIENAMRKAYDTWKPKSMIAIAADPKTMQILGMASLPDFNPNAYWEAGDLSAYRNKAVSFTYEPGSTFKIVTLAGTIQEGIFNPNDKYQSGSINVPGRVLHDHNNVGWGRITYMEGLLRSSNVAFVKLGYEQLGENKLKQYIDRFGFGQKTGIDLPGEQQGLIAMRYPSEFATATYGQGLTVTAIQQLASYGVIANGGKLMKPYIIKEISDHDTHEVVQRNTPQVVRQVISEKTAKEAALDLEQVVSNQEIGTGRQAYIEGYRVAAKTGTANVVLPGEKTYADGQWLVSFAGFAPVEDPKIVVVVIAETPDLQGNYHLGSSVVAPVFKEIISQSLSYMGVTTDATPAKLSNFGSTVKVPNVTGLELDDAESALNQSGLRPELIGKGRKVLKQIPAPGKEVPSTQRVYLMTQQEDTAAVPSLVGKSLRDALEICSLLDVKCKTKGEGIVVSQTVAGDSNARELSLELKPPDEAMEMMKEENGTKKTEDGR